jgi:hypothetical protein
MVNNFLTSGKVGNIATNMNKEARTKIVESWEGMGFLNGLDGYLKENMATIYENQANALLNEATASDNSGSFETVVFPLVGRVFSRLLANDIVSVQAMNLPVGKLFFILPKTSERREDGSHAGLMGYERTNRNTGESEARFYLPDEVVGGAGADALSKMQKKSLYDLFYNDGLFDQSKGKITIMTGKADLVAEPVLYVGDNSYRNLVLAISGFSQVSKGRLIGADGNEMDTEAFLASLKVVPTTTIDGGDTHATLKDDEEVHYRCVTQRYGHGLVHFGDVVAPDGCIYIELDLAKPTKKSGETFDGYVGVKEAPKAEDFVVSWAQYDSLELETEIGEVSFELSNVTVAVEERKLRASWSPELAQDVAAFHNIDAEAELTAILSEQIAAEIDREILRDLRHAAPWQLRWDYNGWRRQGGFSTNYTQKDWNQTFVTKLNQISAQIHKATLRGGANFVVVSTEISAILNDLEYFHVTDASAEQASYSMGIEKIGSLQGRYQVYVDPYAPANSCIVGHKGDSLLDTGYIYAPYVPMQLTPVIYNPNNFAPVRGIMTRYAKKVVNNRYYGAIVCDGLQQWDVRELR